MIKKCRWFGFGCFPVLFVLFCVYQDFRVEAATANQTTMVIHSTEEETETPNDSTNEEVTMTHIRMDQENSTYESTTITERCGGDIVSSKGNISSPNFPNNYGPYENCIWRITAPQESRIVLKFTSFQLEQDGSCNYDYVKIQDGHESSSNSLGTFCGSRIPAVIFSSGNKMTVTFKSDVNEQYKGFTAEFEEVSCGANITSNEGNISSPNFPNNYGQYEKCVWRITVQEGHPVVLTFTDFQLEQHSECWYDYVKVLDGHELSSPILGKFCGGKTPNTTVSSGNKMTIEFKTDISGHYGGFFAIFNRGEAATANETIMASVSREEQTIVATTILTREVTTSAFDLTEEQTTGPNITMDVVTQQAASSSGGCGGNIISDDGNIFSPNFPNNYGPYHNCIWKITVQQGYPVVLRFTDFRLEQHEACKYDYVKVFDGSKSNSPILGTFCGKTIPDVIVSSGNKMRVDFKTDSLDHFGGFRATFNKGEATTGQIIMTNVSMEENATAIGITNEQATARSYPMDVNTTTYEGTTISGGDNNSANDASNSTDTKGACGGNITSNEGNISSPNYPNKYRPDENCIWRITVEEHYPVDLKFRFFELERDDQCEYDYVRILDGHNSSSRVLGTFCGASIPVVTKSSENKMTVIFKSDDQDEYKGFSAEFKRGGCGKIHVYNEGSISSPNYPDSYARNEDCIWWITVPEGYRVRLRFTSFRLEAHTECRYDYVRILDGHGSDSPSLGKYCGSFLPTVIRSSSNKMTVEFKTDSTDHYAGFVALFDQDGSTSAVSSDSSFVTRRKMATTQLVVPVTTETPSISNSPNYAGTTTSSACGRINVYNQGSISSPNYPHGYQGSEECVWWITVPEGYRVVLRFVSFQLERHDECNYDFVKILDGHESSSPTLGKFCGDGPSYPIVSSSSNKMTVQFQSDSLDHFSGFYATFNSSMSTIHTTPEISTAGSAGEETTTENDSTYEGTVTAEDSMDKQVTTGKDTDTTMENYTSDENTSVSASKIPDLTNYYIIGAAVGLAFLLIAISLIVRRSRRSRGNEAKEEEIELHPDSQKSEWMDH